MPGVYRSQRFEGVGDPVMRDLIDTTDPVLLRVDRKLRQDTQTAWDRYESTCRTGGTPEQRQYAYDIWTALEHKFWDAEKVAVRDHDREKAKLAAKAKAKAGSGK